MTDALRKYLSRLPNTRTLAAGVIEDYQDEMASKVIPKNLRGSFEKRRIATEARARGVQRATKQHDKGSYRAAMASQPEGKPHYRWWAPSGVWLQTRFDSNFPHYLMPRGHA